LVIYDSLNLIFKHRKVLLATTMSDVKGKYLGTAFGITWSFIYPLLFLSLYAVVYSLILKIRIDGKSTFDYVLFIFAGLIPFLGFAESLGTGVTCVTSSKSLIKNTLFPVALIPVKAVFTSSFTMFFGLVILLTILWCRGDIYITQLMVIPIFILQLLFTIGLIWILSTINVFFRDLGQMVAIMTLFLMLVSPIAYSISMIPHRLMILMYPNPLFYMIMLYRSCIVSDKVPVLLFLIFTCISLITFFFGYYVINKLKPLFADYV